MRIAPVAEIKARFSAYLRASAEASVIVTRHGKPVAVLLAIEDEDALEDLILAYSPCLQRMLKAGRKQIRESGGIGHDAF